MAGYIEKGVDGRREAYSGRARVQAQDGDGFFLGPTIFDNVRPEMTIAREEIFGPVLSVIRVRTLDEAIELVNSSRIRQHDLDFHQQRQGGAGVSAPRGGGDGRRQCRRGRAHGVLPVRGLEEFVFRRSARARQGRRYVLHRAKSADDPVVLTSPVVNQDRQPVHTVYGGAQLFKAGNAGRDWARMRSI